MDEVRDVLPINTLVGMTVLSRATGNKLGNVRDLSIDPASGALLGLTIATDGGLAALSYDDIYSFGRDAIMAERDDSVKLFDEERPAEHANAKEHLIGTKVITESGQLLGQIADILVTLQPPPFVVYEIRESLIDRLLGRGSYILASGGHALSDDAERLVVPDGTAEGALSDITELINQALSIRTFRPGDDITRVAARDADVTWVPGEGEDETVVRRRDEEETVLRESRIAGSLE